jgi:hypothetical protein
MTIASMLADLKRQQLPGLPEEDPQPAPSISSVAVAVADTPPPVMSAADLLGVARLRGWEVLQIRPGEQAGGSRERWEVFTGWVSGRRLEEASRAAWTWWPDTVEHYRELAQDPQLAALIGRREVGT